MTCKYCQVGYWVATILALGAFVFCLTLTEVYGWQLSEYCWLLKGLMLSTGVVLVTGLWQANKRPFYMTAWVLSLIGFAVALWQNIAPSSCTVDCERAIFMLGSIGMTPLLTSATLFAILLAMTTTMLIRNKK